METKQILDAFKARLTDKINWLAASCWVQQIAFQLGNINDILQAGNELGIVNIALFTKEEIAALAGEFAPWRELEMAEVIVHRLRALLIDGGMPQDMLAKPLTGTESLRDMVFQKLRGKIEAICTGRATNLETNAKGLRKALEAAGKLDFITFDKAVKFDEVEEAIIALRPYKVLELNDHVRDTLVNGLREIGVPAEVLVKPAATETAPVS